MTALIDEIERRVWVLTGRHATVIHLDDSTVSDRTTFEEFVTPSIGRGAEIRCYMRDPDGYLIEGGQSTGLLRGQRAAERPEDLPG